MISWMRSWVDFFNTYITEDELILRMHVWEVLLQEWNVILILLILLFGLSLIACTLFLFFFINLNFNFCHCIYLCSRMFLARLFLAARSGSGRIVIQLWWLDFNKIVVEASLELEIIKHIFKIELFVWIGSFSLLQLLALNVLVRHLLSRS